MNEGVISLKTLILYSSRYGTTEKCVKLLASEIKGSVDIVNINKDVLKELQAYDNVIVGGSIYAGTLNKEVKKYIEDNAGLLKSKNIGLFLCCQDKSKALEEFMTLNFPVWMIEKAFSREHLGHEIKLEAMNLFEKGLLKYIMKVKKSYSQIDNEAISRLANKVNRLEVANG